MIKDKDSTPVAKTVVTMCTRCEMELNHMVVVHNAEGFVERVKCNTCGSEHKYRRDKEKPPGKIAKKTIRTNKGDFTKTFEKLAEKFKEKEPVPYSMSGSFKNDDVIVHKSFGMGIVTKASNHKIEVVFSDGPRVLVCERKDMDS
ncbi:MAG: hypothetical protein KKE57_03755 [Proteobacteria bacterium]|nr:hypothetical protein [Pseudomonadota bacterium]